MSMTVRLFAVAYLVSGCWLAVLSIATTRCVDAPSVAFYFLLASICAIGLVALYILYDKERRRSAGEITDIGGR